MTTTLTRLFPASAIVLSFLAFQSPDLFQGLSLFIAPGLSLIMLFMGLTLSCKDFYQLKDKWHALCTGVILQFGIMPLTGLLISRCLDLPTDLAIGMILAGSVAGGTASSVFCYLAKGDVALSISMTAVSTMLGSFTTPILIGILVNQYIQIDTIPMIWDVAKVVVLPVGVGLMINHRFPTQVRKMSPVFPFLSMGAIALVVAIVVALNAQIIPALGGITILAVILHNSTGLFLGYGVAYLMGFDKMTRKTIALEVGLQNSGLAVVLATKFFTPVAALPAIFFSIWHNLSGAILATWWSREKKPSSGKPVSQ